MKKTLLLLSMVAVSSLGAMDRASEYYHAQALSQLHLTCPARISLPPSPVLHQLFAYNHHVRNEMLPTHDEAVMVRNDDEPSFKEKFVMALCPFVWILGHMQSYDDDDFELHYPEFESAS